MKMAQVIDDLPNLEVVILNSFLYVYQRVFMMDGFKNHPSIWIYNRSILTMAHIC